MKGPYKPDLLLAQVPLTVSPFISLPTAPTLSYNYKPIPSTLPPSLLTSSPASTTGKPAYIVSSTGHAAHPDDIIASCEAMEAHLAKAEAEGARAVKQWDDAVRERELAEKRRVAPGWLDREEKLLVPEGRTTAPAPAAAAAGKEATQTGAGGNLLDRGAGDQKLDEAAPVMVPRDEGEELDRAFGAMSLGKK